MMKLGATHDMILVPLALVFFACSGRELDGPQQRAASTEGGTTATIFGTGGIGVRVRAEPNTSSARVDSLQDGDVVTITCQTRGELVDGTDVWDAIASPRGYVLDAYVRTGHDGFAPGIDRCDGEPSGGEATKQPEPPEGTEGKTSAPEPDAKPAPPAKGISAIWGGKSAPVTFEFLAPGGLYGYGTSYGLDGVGHTGLDVGLPYGTALFSPMGGELTCAGTNDGPGTDGGGCAAFGDTGDAPPGGASKGVGRIELKLDDGTALILGHSRTCDLRPGQRVKAGQRVGTSGGMNGAHVHVELRVRDGGTSSGWRIVDPRTRLGK